jgi:hypothetical protein
MMVQVPFGAQAAQSTAETIPSYVEIPEAGTYKVSEEHDATGQNGENKIGTDFYLRIEKTWTQEHNESQPESQPSQPESSSVGSSGGSGGNSGGSGGSSGGSGSHIRDEDSSAGNDDSRTQTVTYADFPMGDDEGEEQTQNDSGNLPRTGDYGPDKVTFFELALLFGAGYLVCDHYEKKYNKDQNLIG